MPYVNPFRPSAGAEPPVLIGRSRVTEDFLDGLEEGVGAPGRLMRITGPRGSGKTVLLTELGDIARERGWRVVDVTASEPIADAVLHELQRNEVAETVELEASVGILKARGQAEIAARQETLRDALTREAARLTDRGVGLLVTVDEIQDADEDDVRKIATAIQHLIRERQNIAFVFAGITTGVMDLINGKALTFLRRAKSEELAAIPLADVATAMRATIERAGMRIGAEPLQSLTEATAGYAYLIQLVGYHAWICARRHVSERAEITQQDVNQGVANAMREFNEAVHEPAIADLPRRALEYALAMTEDREVSSTAQIAERLGVPSSSLTTYRRMLIKRQVIEPTARGFVTFAIPYMREFLIDHRDELLARYEAR